MGIKGQWTGIYDGASPGKIVVDIDERNQTSSVYAVVHPDDKKLPSAKAQFDIPKDNNAFRLTGIRVYPIDPKTSNYGVTDELKAAYPGITFATTADISGEWTDTTLKLEWITDLKTGGKAEIPRSNSDKPSEYLAEKVTWDEFKSIVGGFDARRFIFRGQSEPWRLRTSFHRTGRANLQRFRFEDIPALQRHLSGLTRHVYNFAIPDEYGSFLNLVQHHGYPTPLLDWTYSPYVAAFFAFRDLPTDQSKSKTGSNTVRIIVFDQKTWREIYPQMLRLQELHEHFSLLDPLAIDNQRMVPQQSIVSVTNVDDIETYIRKREQEQSKSFLRIFDLPVASRNHVIRELSYMGVTAGALFPGIDGACEELRERFFRL